jgi:hypothetical protein
VDFARIRPGHHHCHTGDLSALIDIASRDYLEVGISGNERVQVGHHTALRNEAAGPARGVESASHHQASVVDACGKGVREKNRILFDYQGEKFAVALPGSGCDASSPPKKSIGSKLHIHIFKKILVNGMSRPKGWAYIVINRADAQSTQRLAVRPVMKSEWR